MESEVFRIFVYEIKNIRNMENLEEIKQDQDSANMILTGANRTHNKCYKCGEIKPISEFCSDKRNPCGHSTLCKECKRKMDREYHKKVMEDPLRHAEENKKRKEWKANNKEKVKASWTEYNNRPEVKQRKQEWQESNTTKSVISEEKYKKEMLRHAKNRADDKNLPFNITLEDLVIPERCPILDTPLLWQDSHKWTNPENVPSLDKIIPEKGYVKGNICVISMKANMMKQDATKEQLLAFAKNIGKYLEKFEDIVQTIENKESIELEDKELQG